VKYLVEPWRHQHEAIERASKLRDFALFFEMGCLAHDTEIKINRGGSLRRYTIEQFYRLFNGVELCARESGFPKESPTYIRAWKDTHIGLNQVEAVVRSGEREIFSLRAKGCRPLKLTAEHKVLTKRGWVEAALLKVDEDFVAIDVLRRHQQKADRVKGKKPQYLSIQVGPYHPYACSVQGYKGKKIIRIEKHRAIFEADLNKMSLKKFQETTQKKNNLKFIDPKKFHIHHRDHNSKNNELQNLACLPAKDHLRLHCKGYINFAHGALAFAKVEGFEYVGPEVTYDIVCKAPWHNFVANDIVVHNSGKTSTAINILRQKFYDAGRVRRTLVLCPPIVIENWYREFGVHSNVQNKVIKLYGSGKKRQEIFQEKVLVDDDIPFGPIKERRDMIVVTNFESLLMPKLFKLFEDWKPEILVVDEVHRCKNGTAKRTKAAIKLADLADHRYILTGTPILNSMLDLFPQFRILDGGDTFGRSFLGFRASYFHDRNSGMPKHVHFPNWQPLPGAEARLHAAIAKKSMHVTKEECLDLPPLVKKQYMVQLSPEQKRLYDEMKKDFVTYMGDSACVATIALTKALRMQQIVSGFIALEAADGSRRTEKLDNPRASALKDLLSEILTHSKCLVWAVWKTDYETIREVCNDLGASFVEVHGEISPKAKYANVDKFTSDPNCRVLIGHPGAAGVGINLVAASYSIFYSRNFSLEQDLQAEARNHRGGSEVHEKITRIDLVAENTIDEIVTKKLALKQEISDKVLKDIATEI
jgi:hypothetical protein